MPSDLEGSGIVTLDLSNHLTAPALATMLAPLTERLRRDAQALRLLLDCRTMTGYDGEARAHFVEWNTAHRRRVERVAVVTGNTLWHMVVSAMSLASRQEMRAFSELDPARSWLSGAPKSSR